MRFVSIASGSSGNCIYTGEDTLSLHDALPIFIDNNGDESDIKRQLKEILDHEIC